MVLLFLEPGSEMEVGDEHHFAADLTTGKKSL